MLARRITAAAAAFALFAATVIGPAAASQNALLSPTTGTVSGLQLTNNYNAALDSLNTANSGATAPVNQLSGSASLGNWWLNSSAPPYQLGMYDGASNWPAIGSLDPSAHAWNLQIGGGVSTLASAATVDLCSTPRNYLTISGTTTITSFGSTCPAGVVKLVTFSGILQLTYNATSLIIPGAASIPATTAGDQATLVALGSGNWQVATYTPASGGALINPAIDVGSYVLTSAVSVPSSKYLLAYGQAVSRTTYASYLAAATITQSVTRTNGSPTLIGFTDTTQIPTGAAVEGSGIPTSTTISSCTSTTCTMSGNASSSGTANVQIFPYGDGNGSTTFNLPNCAGVMLAGRDNMSGTPRGTLTSTYAGANPDALGAFFGSQSHTQLVSEMPSHTHANTLTDPGHVHNENLPTSGGGASNYYPSGGTSNAFQTNIQTQSATTGITITNAYTGGGNPFSIVPPITTVNCMVRVLARLDLPAASFASNDPALPFGLRGSRPSIG